MEPLARGIPPLWEPGYILALGWSLGEMSLMGLMVWLITAQKSAVQYGEDAAHTGKKAYRSMPERDLGWLHGSFASFITGTEKGRQRDAGLAGWWCPG